jgi:spermidine/putrescine transport system permease protein
MAIWRRRRAPAYGPLDYSRRWSLRVVFLVTLVFLYVPILTLMAFSFNDSRRNIVWRGFTLKYYEKAMGNDGLIEAFTNSLTIALISTIVSVILGAMVAILLWRFRFPGKAPLEGCMALPIVIPEICMGVAMLAFFARIGWPSGLPWPLNLSAITIAHISFSFPFAAMVIRARLANFNRELEEAAKDLGASEWETFRDILIPFMKPGLFAGGLLAFTLSLDDFVITFYARGQRGLDGADRDHRGVDVDRHVAARPQQGGTVRIGTRWMNARR